MLSLQIINKWPKSLTWSRSQKDPLSKKADAVFSAPIDFLMVGGASILFLLTALLATALTGKDGVYTFGFLAYMGSFVINFPHFAHSYQLFYNDVFGEIKRAQLARKLQIVFSGFLVPAFILFYVTASYLIVPESISRMVYAMFFFVGWHYAKQGYGVFIVLAAYKKLYFKDWEKTLLRINIHLVWIYTWAAGQGLFIEKIYHNVSYTSLSVPRNILDLVGLVSLVLSFLSFSLIFKIFFWEKRGVSWNGLIGYICGSYLWLGFGSLHPAFALFVPLFHCLQYNLFVYRLKINEQKIHSNKPKEIYKNVLIFVFWGTLLGALFMDILPGQMDQWTFEKTGQNGFFLASFLLFINVHHYFLDSVFWKKENQRVSQFLFKENHVSQ